ncbi:MAG: hypothetical protein KGJ36_07775 [Acidobacteriota bacterium]|nr:hypothetical protein [Acidobacteriota bacterium]
MELRRLVAPLAARDAVPALAAGSPMVLACPDGSAVMVAASLRERLGSPLGVWLSVSASYPAALAARDVATLSHLIDLEHVVVDGENASASAAAVRALLSDEPVDFANEAATLRGAYNRPAPPRPVRVWSVDGDALVGDGIRLRARGRAASGAGEVTSYRDEAPA